MGVERLRAEAVEEAFLLYAGTAPVVSSGGFETVAEGELVLGLLLLKRSFMEPFAVVAGAPLIPGGIPVLVPWLTGLASLTGEPLTFVKYLVLLTDLFLGGSCTFEGPILFQGELVRLPLTGLPRLR